MIKEVTELQSYRVTLYTDNLIRFEKKKSKNNIVE